MTARIARIFSALLGAACVLQLTVAGAAAQTQGSVQRVPLRDSLRIVPRGDDNVIILGFLMQMGLISAELEKLQLEFDREIPGPQRVTITRNLPSTVQGLQQSVQDRLMNIRVICSGPAAPRKAWLGIGVSEYQYGGSPEPEKELPYPKVSSVDPRSPADAAGLEPGDMILKVDGVDVRGRQLKEFVTVPGKKLTFSVERKGASRTFSAVLDSGKAAVPDACDVAVGSPVLRTLYHFDSTLARRLRINPMVPRDTFMLRGTATIRSSGEQVTHIITSMDPGGVVVAVRPSMPSNYALMNVFGAYFSSANHVPPSDAAGSKAGVRVLLVVTNSQADVAGMQREDLVKSVNKKAITSMDDFKAALNASERATRGSLEIEVIRNDKVIPLSIPRQ